jgi:hypothetical protein
MGLVTAQVIKTKTSIGGNVDPDKFMHLLDDVEVLILEPSIGTALYDKIVTDYNEGGTNNLAGDYLEMYNKYIVPILCYSVFSQYLRDGFILAQNTGIYENAPDNKQGAELGNVQYVSKSNSAKADVYLERLERYLCDKNITEYSNSQPENYDINPREVNTISGWFLPKSEPNEDLIYVNGGSGESGDFLELDRGGNLTLD